VIECASFDDEFVEVSKRQNKRTKKTIAVLFGEKYGVEIVK